MTWMLDTDTCIELIRHRPPELVERLRGQPIGEVVLSSLTVAELDFGVEKSSERARNRVALERFLLPFDILPFDRAAAGRYGRLRAELTGRGSLIGSMDMLIAAHALATGSTLVTHNQRDFRKVEGLALEDWL